MRVSYKWLKEYIDLDIPVDELAEKIERSSVEVDSVIKPSEGLKKIVVGQILNLEDHPDSDHLHICQVDVGDDEPVQIVCGAPNVEKGKKVIVALSGARIADNIKIKKSKMRGIQSNGMLCALDEIGYPKDVVPKEWADGIYFLPEDAKVGNDVYKYIGMDDELIDLDVTPNRGDMLSMYGTIHDLSAIYNKPAKFDNVKVQKTSGKKTADQISSDVDSQIALTYKNRIVNNVEIKPSPLWLQICLWNAGIKPINNIIDITNYLMLKFGQPMHAYDLDKLHGNNISVRNAKKGEKITTLAEDEVDLDENDIVVADDRPIALAGVIGGIDTSITNDTKNVLFECAVFDPIKVRKMARKHVIHTEASQRFERGINRGGLDEVMENACQMSNELANGEVCDDTLNGSEFNAQPVVVNITLTKINHVLGTNLSSEQVKDIFERLGFDTKVDGDAFVVTVPTRRWDIHIDADLIEEVARIYGYDNLPSTLPTTTMTTGKLQPKQQLIRNSRSILEGLGLTHAISYALTSQDKAKMFMMQKSFETNLSYPMTNDHETLRMNLVTGLLDDIAYNKARNVHDVALYEQGRVFYKENENEVRPSEIEHISGAITGSLLRSTWNEKAKEVDFYQIKGIVDKYLETIGFINQVEYVANADYPEMHPGRTADIMIHGHYVGFIGEVHPNIAKKFKINTTYVFDLNLQLLNDLPKTDQSYESISKYPSISRDIAILIDENVTNNDILKVINKRGGAFLRDVNLFDVYNGEHVPSGKKSMAYNLIFQNKRDTLVDDDVNKAMDKIQRNLEKEFEIEVR
ncbi:phenylalanine--tRNA ligase subunit beta [Apilactobacillus micheneri]|uniref:Phenylalanine--tRNA ligase beta subunit n=1 Tax=Apilactobacillus micheneri TaxID=1899430 RepID=A0ABY2YXP0_9LACO|nr:phenylalanine--tRNA ligase subunit beta [Apilactobacillus micheneri]TPR25482.1 phenylalanine--tRNA ligase subunit beta [Apilactobacillus micheneri]TPR26586.1 phenylalanine--tRNA ligase subunit beta [Apilactobacillus micheneri]TPR28373.1 phenylalanine--tRNA ligase subunit beta [Apilactobacillus micheneri]TPR29060.1 phenylalanine--tRNA ligase subunit beta [Apilactobacillus micheneri]TPR30649.1 phenylalanine--tRNA ligase subunit beta [Apilactobacillus micheneri]